MGRERSSSQREAYVTPDEVAARAMDALVEQHARLYCVAPVVSGPCEECAPCIASDAVMREFHRLAALYPSVVPPNAPAEVQGALRSLNWRTP